jgi:dTDP-4-amino-4,6-dideoxygalactose transaminase
MLLDALGIRPGDEVIVSALTCRVVVLAIQSAGCRPVYADLQSSGALNMDAVP